MDGRINAIFGPNILYRILLFSFFYSLYEFWSSSLVERMIRVYLILLSAIGIILTGSVGAVISLTFILFILTPVRIAFIASIVILVTTLFSENIIGVLGDSVLVEQVLHKLGGDSESIRLIGWKELLERSDFPFILNHADFGYLWGPYFQYPHNIFIELFVFYGVVGLCLSVFIIWTVFKFVKYKHQIDRPIFILFFVSFFGSLISGSLADNFSVVALIGMLSVFKERLDPIGF